MAKSKQFLESRQAKVGLGTAAFVAAWFMFIRAVDTGSLQQYAMLLILLGFGVNRLVRAIFPKQ